MSEIVVNCNEDIGASQRGTAHHVRGVKFLYLRFNLYKIFYKFISSVESQCRTAWMEDICHKWENLIGLSQIISVLTLPFQDKILFGSLSLVFGLPFSICRLNFLFQWLSTIHPCAYVTQPLGNLSVVAYQYVRWYHITVQLSLSLSLILSVDHL